MSTHDSSTAITPSGMTPEQVCREAADWFDTIDEFFTKVQILDGDDVAFTAADVAGRDDEVQRDLRAVADWIESLKATVLNAAVGLDRLHTTVSLNEQHDVGDALHPIIADLMQALGNDGSDGVSR